MLVLKHTRDGDSVMRKAETLWESLMWDWESKLYTSHLYQCGPGDSIPWRTPGPLWRKKSPKLHLVGNLEETFLYQGDFRHQLLSWGWNARKMGSWLFALSQSTICPYSVKAKGSVRCQGGLVSQRSTVFPQHLGPMSISPLSFYIPRGSSDKT